MISELERLSDVELDIFQDVIVVNEDKRYPLTGQLCLGYLVAGYLSHSLLQMEENPLHVYRQVWWVGKQEVYNQPALVQPAPEEPALVGKVQAMLQPTTNEFIEYHQFSN